MEGNGAHHTTDEAPQQGTDEPFTVHRLDHVPSYDEFLHNYLIPNRACLLPPALVEDWPAIKEWAGAPATTSPSSSSSTLHPAFDLLATRYGHHIVPIVITTVTRNLPDGGEDEQHEERKEMKLADAVQEMRSNARLAAEGGNDDDDGPPRKLYYIKDWHLVRLARMEDATQQQGSISPVPLLPYSTPEIFRDDWMNNDHPTSSSSSTLPDDFRFCYAGTAGTRTPLHRDVYTSYSWSTNVVGRKKWTLYEPEPGLSALLRRAEGRGGARLSGGERRELERRKREEGRSVSVVVQEQGETIFVPSDCYHEVENLTDTISLNHNWCNSINLPRMYASMKEEMREVRRALSDVEEMLKKSGAEAATSSPHDDDVVSRPPPPPPPPWQQEFYHIIQSVSRSDSGWDWAQFWDMVKRWIESSPGCEARLQPDWETWTRPRLKEICEDFRTLDEWGWVGEGEEDGEGKEGVRGVVRWVEERCAGE